jgi:hypothetical protein
MFQTQTINAVPAHLAEHCLLTLRGLSNLVAQRGIQHPDRRIIRMQQVAAHNIRLNPL